VGALRELKIKLQSLENFFFYLPLSLNDAKKRQRLNF
jgi:hypothetical protein